MWPNPQFPVDLVTFTEEIFMENFIFCAVLKEVLLIFQIATKVHEITFIWI